MALSEDAKGIIAEIRSQANTTRHKSEQYSLKAVRADLSKFQGVFEAMNANLSLMTGNAEAAADAAARQAALAQLSEDERAKLARDAASREKRENDLKNRDLKLREKEMKKREKSDFKIFGKDGILGNMFGGAMGLVKKALFIGIGGSILYELTAGFLERFGVDLPPIADVAKKFGDLATSVDWEDLKKNLNELAAADFGALAATVALGTGATVALPLAGEALEAYKNYRILDIIRKMITPDADDVDAAGKVGDKSGKISGKRMAFRGIRLGIAGLIFTGLSSAMPAVENLFRKYALGMTEDEIANTRVDGVDIAGNLVTSLSAIFLPGGPLVKLAAGLAIFTFKTLADYLEDEKNLGPVRNKVKDLENERLSIQKKLDEATELQAKLLTGGHDVTSINKRIADLKAKLQKLNESAVEELRQDVTDTYTEMKTAQDQLAKLDPKDERFTQEFFINPMTGSGQYIERTPEEAAKAFLAEEERLKALIETKRTQLNATGLAAQEYNLTPADIGLIQTGNKTFMTQMEVNQKREDQERVRRDQTIIDAFNKKLREDESRSMELLVQGEAKSVQEVLKRLGAFDPVSPINLVLNAPNNSQTTVDASSRTALQSSTTKIGDLLSAPTDNAYGKHVSQ